MKHPYDAIEKFNRDKPRFAARTMTIWEIPGIGLYRVWHTARSGYHVETLSQNGWIELMIFGPTEDEVSSRRCALDLWLEIQTQTPSEDDPS